MSCKRNIDEPIELVLTLRVIPALMTACLGFWDEMIFKLDSCIPRGSINPKHAASDILCPIIFANEREVWHLANAVHARAAYLEMAGERGQSNELLEANILLGNAMIEFHKDCDDE